MTNLTDFEVYTTQIGGKWVVATNASPYFCFEGDSEQAVLAKARRALRFVCSVREELAAEEGREQIAPAWQVKPAKELAVA
jgi:predicted RNase H-like HicB family nuclease